MLDLIVALEYASDPYVFCSQKNKKVYLLHRVCFKPPQYLVNMWQNAKYVKLV